MGSVGSHVSELGVRILNPTPHFFASMGGFFTLSICVVVGPSRIESKKVNRLTSVQCIFPTLQ